MLNELFEELAKIIIQLKKLPNSEDVDIWTEIDKRLAVFVAYDKYDHADTRKRKEIRDNLKGIKNKDQLRIIMRDATAEINLKRSVYFDTLKKMTTAEFWNSLSQRNQSISKDDKERLAKLQHYFTSISDVYLYRLPLALIIGKIKLLQRIQSLLTSLQDVILKNQQASEDFTPEISKKYDLLTQGNEYVKELLKVHSSVLLSKLHLLKYAPYYVDDPLPYALSMLERTNIKQHGIPAYSWAPASEVTADLIESAFAASHQYGKKMHTHAGKIAQQQASTETSFIQLVIKRHTNIRYMSVCPLNVAVYLERSPPRFPSIMQGAKRRFDFFKTAWLPLKTINSLAEEINDITSKPSLHKTDYDKLLAKLGELEGLIQTHEAEFKAKNLPKTRFNKIFRTETLGFQDTWNSSIVALKQRYADLELAVSTRIVNDSYQLRKDYLENKLTLDNDTVVASDTMVRLMTEKLQSTFKRRDYVKPCQTFQLDVLCKKRNYLFKIPTLSIISTAKNRQTYGKQVANFIDNNLLNNAIQYIEFGIFSAERRENNYKVSLSDLHQIERAVVNILQKEIAEPDKDVARLTDIKRLLKAFDHLLFDEEKSIHSERRQLWRELKARYAVSSALTAISDSLIQLGKTGEWKWPLADKDVKMILRCETESVKKSLTEQASTKQLPILRVLGQVKQRYAANASLVSAFTALVHFINQDVPAFEHLLSKVRHVSCKPAEHLSSIPKPVSTINTFITTRS